MIYELGNIDRYGIAVNGTVMENASFFSVRLKELINENKLYQAILIAVGFTYLGKVQLKKELYEKIESFGFRTWPDIGHCCVAAIDFNGTLFLDFCENYVDKEVIPSFIKICKNYGLIANIEKEEIFEQASMKVNYEL